MIAWRASLDLVCRTRGTCLRWFSFDSAGRCWGGRCARGCGGADCQWLVRPMVRRFARGTSPPEREDATEPVEAVAVAGAEPVPLRDSPSGPARAY